MQRMFDNGAFQRQVNSVTNTFVNQGGLIGDQSFLKSNRGQGEKNSGSIRELE